MAKKEKKKKEPKRKPKYGLFSCVGYIYRLMWKYEKKLVFVAVLTVPVSLALSVLALYTPPTILSALEKYDVFSPIALTILGLLFAKLLFDITNNYLEIKINNSEHFILLRMMYIRSCKMRDRDFYHDFDPEIQKMDKRANSAINNNHTDGVHFPMQFSGMLREILKFILFGSVISMLNPIIIVLLVVFSGVGYMMNRIERARNFRDRDARNTIDQKIYYSIFQLSRDFRYAKDIRLYSMADYLHNGLQMLFSQSLGEQKKIENRSLLTAVVSFLVVLIRDGAAYAFLIYKAVAGEVDAASFVLYFSAITSMSGLLSGLLERINSVFRGAEQVSDYREDLEVHDKLNRGAGILLPEGPFSIEFKNVSFKYPKGEKKVLDNVSFKIEAGEKVALVGLNGAGKTTLTRLMCGMLVPDEGDILLNGHSIFEYNRDEMFTLFGFVPQSYTLLPISIAQNIACAMTDDEIDREKLNRCIEMAGLSEKMSSLPHGTDTPLDRSVYKDAVELSGGETQRLLLARLLYKNPPCIILDEPTAALDPIAEDRMYQQYNDISSHATSVFISHRLASTRFCDRIFLLDGANFAEVGTHEDLMAAGGKYRELFDVQSKYYKEGASHNEE